MSHEDDELSVANRVESSEEGLEESLVSIGVVDGHFASGSELSTIRAVVGNVEVVAEATKPVVCIE